MKPMIIDTHSHERDQRWYRADSEAWLAAAMRAKANGFVQKPNRWREATFHKNGEVWALVRNLGKLNWHLVKI